MQYSVPAVFDLHNQITQTSKVDDLSNVSKCYISKLTSKF